MTDAPGSANRNEEAAGGVQRLRAERERRGLQRQQVADSLHVDVGIIEALEAGRFASLGAPVYARGHLRKYAELLGLDAERLLSAFAPEIAQEPELVPVSPARESRPEAPVNLIGAVVIAVIIAGTAWWALSGRDAKAPASSPGREVAETPAIVTSSEPAAATAVAPAELAAPSAGGLDVPPAPVAKAPEMPAAPATQSERLGAAAAAAGTPVRLRLSFSADSWVELYDAGGRRLYFDVGAANSVRSFTAAAPVRVFLGNADGVQLEVNGEAVAVPEQVRRGNVARFTVDARGQVHRTEG
jgi:cytoskeleton protein RodZ